jgi:hypothetical protein
VFVPLQVSDYKLGCDAKLLRVYPQKKMFTVGSSEEQIEMPTQMLVVT